MTINCPACNLTLPNDSAYLEHINGVHGTNSPDEAMRTSMAVEMNAPKMDLLPAGLPPGVTAADLPSPELMNTINQYESTGGVEPIMGGHFSDADQAKLLAQGFPVEALNSGEPAISEPAKSKKGAKTSPIEKVDLEPIQLVYRYTGFHKCGGEVDTLMIKAKGTLNAVAHCPTCKKQVKTIEVNPIKGQEEVSEK